METVMKATHLSDLTSAITSLDRVSVVLPDCTRPLPFERAMPFLERVLPNLEHWVVGLGLHRTLTDRELSRLSNLTPKTILQHNPDCCTEIDVVDGESLGVFSPLFDTDWTLSVGVIEVHQYAGVSGGYKGVVVGCGSRSLISRLHRRALVCDSNVVVGRISNNPFRAEIERLGARTPCTRCLAWVPSLQEWWYGTPNQLMVEADRYISPWSYTNQLFDGIVLNVPETKATSLYQASRAATYLALSPNPPLKDGATIVLNARMIEGIGSEIGFVNALQRFKHHWQDALLYDLSGAGAQRMWMLARLAKRFKLGVLNPEDPELFLEFGLDVVQSTEISESWPVMTDPFNQILQCSDSVMPTP